MSDQPPAYEEASSTSAAAQDEIRKPLNGQDTKYAMLSLAGADRIRLVRFPKPMTAIVTGIIQRYWRKGTQNVRSEDEGVEFKLKGNPFQYDGDNEKVAIRIVMLEILDAFAKQGWFVLPGGGALGWFGNAQQHSVQRENIIFHHTDPVELSWLCMSLDSDNLLHLINAPDELAEAIMQTFGSRVEQCNKDLVSGNFELKLGGKSWSSSVDTSLVLLDLLQSLETLGYTLGSSIDLDGGSGGSLYRSCGGVWFCYR